MKRILLNADIGERGPLHPADRTLMDYIDIANIACGGHAGDGESVAAFRTLAAAKGIIFSAHLSYPDREGFGRKTVVLPHTQLLHSLDEQLALMPDAGVIKFHGALYNDSAGDAALAARLCEWMMEKKTIASVIAPHGSEIAERCRRSGMKVMAEAFAERRYTYSPAAGRLSLVDRQRPYAFVTDTDEAIRMVRAIVHEGKVPAFFGDVPDPGEVRMIDIVADTICIHSDSPIALDLARSARAMLDEKYGGRHGVR